MFELNFIFKEYFKLFSTQYFTVYNLKLKYIDDIKFLIFWSINSQVEQFFKRIYLKLKTYDWFFRSNWVFYFRRKTKQQ
jgi:hypothetical protein